MSSLPPEPPPAGFTSSVPPTGPPPIGPPPASPPPPSYGAPAGPAFDWRRLVAGNWVGSALVALATLAAAGGLGLVMALLVKPADFGVGNTLNLATAIAAGAFGADFTASGSESDYDFDVSLGVFPLTVTIAVLALMIVLFRRMIRSYPAPTAALGDAVRVAVMVGVGLMVAAIIFRGDNDSLGRGWGGDLDASSGDDRFDYGVDVAEALFLGFLIVLVVLAVVVWCRRDWWPPRVQRVHDVVTAAVYGHVTLIALLPLVGLAGFLLLGFGEHSIEDNDPSDNLRELLTVVVAGLASGGVWLLTLGSGASYGTAARGEGADESEYYHLWGVITDDEPGLWAAPVLLLLVLAAAAIVVVRRSPTRQRAFGSLMVWVGSLLVVVPLLVRLSGIHASFTSNYDYDYGDGDGYGYGDESSSYSVVVGPEGVQSTVFVVLVALVVAIVVARLLGALDVAAVRAKLSTLQITPAAGPPPPPYAPPPPPTYEPPSGPPPGTPPT